MRSGAPGPASTLKIEVEFQTAALELALNGLGDTLVSYFTARPYESSNRRGWPAVRARTGT